MRKKIVIGLWIVYVVFVAINLFGYNYMEFDILDNGGLGLLIAAPCVIGIIQSGVKLYKLVIFWLGMLNFINMNITGETNLLLLFELIICGVLTYFILKMKSAKEIKSADTPDGAEISNSSLAWGIASLILGIVAFILSISIFTISILAIPCAIIVIVLASVSLKRKIAGSDITLIGLFFAILSLVISIISNFTRF
ncbi:MAG: hypothetical protein ACERKZ_21245 [Lachnotalea sp.]